MGKRKAIKSVKKKEISEEEMEFQDNMSALLGELQPAKKIMKIMQVEEDSKTGQETIQSCRCDTDNKEDSDMDESFDIENGVKVDNVPFSKHFENNLPEDIVKEIKRLGKMQKLSTEYTKNLLRETFGFQLDKKICNMNDHVFDLPNDDTCDIFGITGVKEKLVQNWKKLNKNKKFDFTHLQRSLYEVISIYKDLFYSDRNFKNAEEIRRLYSLHAVSHVLKSRARILKNNAKLTKAAENGTTLEDLRDQGITRPKVLIIVPFKDSCYKIVNCMASICFGRDKKAQISKKKRFKTEFFTDELEKSQSFRPDDFKFMFEGNIDDCFRIGISLSKNSMKLFAPFYSADIIIASPLGLRTIIGSKNEKQDYDFLSSIEVLIMDQTEVFLMQNWEHVLTTFDHLHLTPKSSHDADFSRLRMWNVNGWSKYYRQTLIFSSLQCPELNNIFNRYCSNFTGKVKLQPQEICGSIQQVVSEIPQVFHRVNADTYTAAPDKRFEYFTEKVLPDLKSRSPDSIAIFVPSYFDFVRIRNYFKKEEFSFVQISEYSKKSYMSQARSLFKEKRKQFLIFTGRYFFYYRHRITGIKHILFYDLPLYGNFYSDIVNFLDCSQSPQNSSCISLFTRYDANKLERVVGSDRFKTMLTSKSIHMLVTGS